MESVNKPPVSHAPRRPELTSNYPILIGRWSRRTAATTLRYGRLSYVYHLPAPRVASGGKLPLHVVARQCRDVGRWIAGIFTLIGWVILHVFDTVFSSG